MFGRKKAMRQRESVLLARLTSRANAQVEVNAAERAFFLEFERQLTAARLAPERFRAERMSSGAIRVSCSAGIVGSVDLRGQTARAQYFLSAFDKHSLSDAPIEAAYDILPYWINYAKKIIAARERAMKA